MIRLTALLALSCCLPSSEWTSPDKRMHLAAGAGIGLCSAATVDSLSPRLHPLARAALIAMPIVAAAVGKELYDARHPDRHTPDARDAIATIAGGTVAIGITWRF